MKNMRMFQCGRDSTRNKKGTNLDSSGLAMTLNIFNARRKSVTPKYIDAFIHYLDYMKIATMQQEIIFMMPCVLLAASLGMKKELSSGSSTSSTSRTPLGYLTKRFTARKIQAI